MPLTASTSPSSSAWTTAFSGSRTSRTRPRAVTSLSDGPQSGQALGWAWKRRSPGSWYSAWHAGHIEKPAIVVRRPVVRHAAHDGEARPAVRAVDEGVAVAAVGGVEQLAKAVGADGGVGGDRSIRLTPALALHDREAGFAGRRQVLRRHPLDPGERRRVGRQPSQEGRDRVRLTLDLQQHTLLVVEHPAGQPVLGGEPEHVGAKSHPLDRALHPGAYPAAGALDRAHARSTSSRSAW